MCGDCGYGICDEYGDCICDDGWTGDKCRKPECCGPLLVLAFIFGGLFVCSCFMYGFYSHYPWKKKDQGWSADLQAELDRRNRESSQVEKKAQYEGLRIVGASASLHIAPDCEYITRSTATGLGTGTESSSGGVLGDGRHVSKEQASDAGLSRVGMLRREADGISVQSVSPSVSPQAAASGRATRQGAHAFDGTGTASLGGSLSRSSRLSPRPSGGLGATGRLDSTANLGSTMGSMGSTGSSYSSSAGLGSTIGGVSAEDKAKKKTLRTPTVTVDRHIPEVLEVERKMHELVGKPLLDRKQGIRDLIMEYHPDKSDHPRAKEIFHAINAMKEELLRSPRGGRE